jgi:hypothetical protein
MRTTGVVPDRTGHAFGVATVNITGRSPRSTACRCGSGTGQSTIPAPPRVRTPPGAMKDSTDSTDSKDLTYV